MTPGLSQLCTEYLSERANLRHPQTTIDGYTSTFRWLETTSTSLADFDRIDLLPRLTAQSPGHWKPGTLKLHLAHVCTFARWLQARGLCNREHRMTRTASPPKFRNLPTEAELARLLSHAEQLTRDCPASRQRANDQHLLLLRLLAETGARIGELIALDQNSNIAGDDCHYLTILGTKSRDSERGLEVSADLFEQIEHFKRRHQSDHPPLFQNSRGQRLTTRAFNAWLTETCLALKLKTHVHPHVFRYRLIVQRILAGDNPFEVRRRVGHRDLQMTLYYFDQVERMLPFAELNQWRKLR
jgi:integrase